MGNCGRPHVRADQLPYPKTGGYKTILRGGASRHAEHPGARRSAHGQRREVATSIPFDEAAFDHFHLYDLDFSFRAIARVCARGLSGRRDDPPVGGKLGADWDQYRRRFEASMARTSGDLTPKSGASAGFFAATLTILSPMQSGAPVRNHGADDRQNANL